MTSVNAINPLSSLRLPSNGGSTVTASPPAGTNNTAANNQDASFVLPTEDPQEETEVTRAVKKHSFLQTLKNWVEGTISFLDAGLRLLSKWGKQAWGAISDKFPYLLAIVPAILVALFLGKGAIDNSVKSAPTLQNDKMTPVTV